MAKLNEIVFDILELLRGSNISDDTNISEDQIIYHINNQRALWMRNEYSKPGRRIDNQLEQDLGCLRLIEVDPAECCEISTGCYVLRTEKRLPKFLELHSGPAITRVGPVNKVTTPFNLMSQSQAVWALSGKYSAKQIVAVIINEYIYILVKDTSLMGLEYINVRGILANPMDLADYKCDASEEACYTMESEYPIGNWMIPYIKEQILQQFGVALQTPSDKHNDAKEDTIKK